MTATGGKAIASMILCIKLQTMKTLIEKLFQFMNVWKYYVFINDKTVGIRKYYHFEKCKAFLLILLIVHRQNGDLLALPNNTLVTLFLNDLLDIA